MKSGTTALVVLGLLAAALPARAEEACDAWFPDFNCGRSGRFAGFEKPIVAPYLFEDPFITTNAVPYFLWHDFPDHSVFDGGGLYAAALQLRVALTDRVAIIATKDGYVWNRNDNPLLEDSEIPLNAAEQSSSLFDHLYAGLDLTPWVQPFVQLSELYWMESGNGDLPIRLKTGGTLDLSTVQAALDTRVASKAPT